MNDDNLLGGVLGQLGQTVKQAAKQVAKVPEEMAKDTAGQVGSAKQNTNENKASENKLQWQSDEERIKFLKDLYGSKDMSEDGALNSNKNTNPSDKKLTEFQEQIADKSPEEQKKLIELRNQLHKENYYDPTFNPVKNPPAGGEERPAEKVENEKRQEMMELQKKEEKKPPPLAVQKAAQRVENLPGAG